MMVLRAGVLGMGTVGVQHALGYHELPGVELAAVCDTDSHRCAEALEELRHQALTPVRTPAVTTDAGQILRDPNIDVVSVCTYDDAHAEQVVEALEHGKHVMVEKPAVLHRDELGRVVSAWRRSRQVLTSNLILRMSPRFRALRRAVQAGTLGTVFYMEGDYVHHIVHKIQEGWRGRMDFYCVLYGGGIHLIDLMMWLADESVVEVGAMAGKKITADGPFAFPDTIVTSLLLHDGTLAKSLTSFASCHPHFHALQVHGSRGTFVNSPAEGRLYGRADAYRPTRRFRQPSPGVPKWAMLPGFLAAVRAQRPPDVPAEDVFSVMNVCLTAWESWEQKRILPVPKLP